MLYRIVRLFIVLLFKILFRVRVRGSENIPKKGAFIVASNHVSFLDPIALGVASPRPLNFMARDDLFSNRVFGWLIRNLNAFPVKREDKEDVGAIREALKRLRKGNGLVIFPEGGRGDSDILREGKIGAALLAYRSGAPIVPAFVKGSDKALPRDAKFIRLESISVIFGNSIDVSKLELIPNVVSLRRITSGSRSRTSQSYFIRERIDRETALRKKQIYKEITERVMEVISRLKDEN